MRLEICDVTVAAEIASSPGVGVFEVAPEKARTVLCAFF
jgi:hypothetical protein